MIETLFDAVDEALASFSENPSALAASIVIGNIAALLNDGGAAAQPIFSESHLVRVGNNEAKYLNELSWMAHQTESFEFQGIGASTRVRLFGAKKVTRNVINLITSIDENWEDALYTRSDTRFPVGIDFVYDNGGSIWIALRNYENRRVVRLSRKLTNTNKKVLSNWRNINLESEHSKIHEALWNSFDVQPVNKEFYEGIAGFYDTLVLELVKGGWTEPRAKLFATRLLGRMLFTWYLALLGVVPRQDLQHAIETEDDAYNRIVTVLFFQVLGTPEADREEFLKIRYPNTPYIGISLFEEQEEDRDFVKLHHASVLGLRELVNHFAHFDFATDESATDFEQVAIDPEMLGKVLENLLATQLTENSKSARRALGAYYTPREIVEKMCRESIFWYLKSQLIGQISDEQLSNLVFSPSYEYESDQSNRSSRALINSQRRLVRDKLRRIKLIDPACGSGAFPMGALHVLVAIESRLDARMNVHSAKLHYLEHCIFGSDIAPIAVEFSKLRSWLTLLVEEGGSSQPLPNLELNYVCANSLVQLVYEEDLFGDPKLASKLADMRHQYFGAQLPKQKSLLREKYLKTINQVRFDGFEGQRSSQLRSFNPFAPKEHASFFDSEYMFGIRDGFDIVIGNPPYVDYRSIDQETRAALGSYIVGLTSRKINLYVYFFELASRIQANNGVIAFITPQQYLALANTRGVRELLSKQTCRLLEDYSNVKLFAAATYTFVSVWQSVPPEGFAKVKVYGTSGSAVIEKESFEISNPLSEPIILNPTMSSWMNSISETTTTKLGDFYSEIFCACSEKVEVGDNVDWPLFVEVKNIQSNFLLEPQNRVNPERYSKQSRAKQNNFLVLVSRMTPNIRAVAVDNRADNYLGGKINVITTETLEEAKSLAVFLNSAPVNHWFKVRFSATHMQGGALSITTEDLKELPFDQKILQNDEFIELAESAQVDNSLDVQRKIDQIVGHAYCWSQIESHQA